MLRILLATLTAVAVVCATVLEATDHSPDSAWKLVGVFAALLVGQHLDKPSP